MSNDRPPAADITARPLPAVIAARAAVEPTRPLLADVAGGRLTFGEVHLQACRWANALAAAGIGHGAAVASMLPNCVDHYPLWLGIGQLGALEVPINVELRGNVLRHILAHSEVEVIVVAAAALANLSTIAGELPQVRLAVVVGDAGAAMSLPWPTAPAAEFLAASATAEPSTSHVPALHDVASILYTSGTTGPSKGVIVSWAQINAGCVVTERFGDGADDRFYATGSPNHVVSKGAFATAANTGGQLLVRPAFSLSEFWEDVRGFGATSTVLVGAMADFLLNAEPRPDDPDSTLRNVLMAPVTRRVEEFNKRFGTRTWTAYNMTEISVPFVSDGFTIEDPASCGRLRDDYPFYEARLVDDFDNEVAEGEVGELIVRTSVPWTLNSGYLNHPAETARAWRNGWFHTGDAFRRDAAGRYYFVDRMKDTIRRRGENVSSFEIEAEVLSHPDVAECAAVAVPADEAEDEIKIVVVLREGASLEPHDLLAHIAERAPRYMLPRYVEYADALPRTQTLRVQKALLRSPSDTPVWDRQAARWSDAPPSTH